MWRIVILLAATMAMGRYGAAQAAKPGDSRPSAILVLRFDSPDDASGTDWIGRAAQEDLASDLTRGAIAKIKAPFETHAPADVDAALKRGREQHAAYVVFGQAQSVDDNVRITTQVLDVASGQSLGSGKITGPRSSLFDMEDALARQVFALLPQSMLKPDVLQSLQEEPPASVVQMSPPEPEPIRIFPAFASPDYAFPERYESDPAIIINVAPEYNAVVPAYTYLSPPPFTNSPFLYSPYAYGFPLNTVGAFYDSFAAGWYPACGYPFGYPGYGGVVIVNNGFGFRRGFGFHHHGGMGGSGNPSHGWGNAVASSGGNPVALQFNWQGSPIVFGGIPAQGFRPAVPAGGFRVGIPNTNFNSFAGPRFGGGMRGMGFGGPAFGGGIHGGSAVH